MLPSASCSPRLTYGHRPKPCHHVVELKPAALHSYTRASSLSLLLCISCARRCEVYAIPFDSCGRDGHSTSASRLMSCSSPSISQSADSTAAPRQCTHPCRSPEFSHATHSSWGPARSNVHGRLRVALGSACRCWTRAHASEREPIADSSAVRSALPQSRPWPDSSLANPIEVWSTSRPGGITAAAQQLEP